MDVELLMIFKLLKNDRSELIISWPHDVKFDVSGTGVLVLLIVMIILSQLASCHTVLLVSSLQFTIILSCYLNSSHLLCSRVGKYLIETGQAKITTLNKVNLDSALVKYQQAEKQILFDK